MMTRYRDGRLTATGIAASALMWAHAADSSNDPRMCTDLACRSMGLAISRLQEKS